MRPSIHKRRRVGFIGHVAHFGREFARHADAFVRRFGPAIRMAAMSAAPALAAAGAPQAAATATIAGQATDSYSQLRQQMGD